MLFKKGMLYVRCLDGEILQMFYPDEDVLDDSAGFHVQIVARMHYGHAEPYFVSAVECASHGSRTGSGSLVEYREASDDDILIFINNWREDILGFFVSWVRQVVFDRCHGLAEEEQDRVWRLVGPKLEQVYQLGYSRLPRRFEKLKE